MGTVALRVYPEYGDLRAVKKTTLRSVAIDIAKCMSHVDPNLLG